MRNASRQGEAEEVQRCLDAGADVDAGCPTVLWFAAWRSR